MEKPSRKPASLSTGFHPHPHPHSVRPEIAVMPGIGRNKGRATPTSKLEPLIMTGTDGRPAVEKRRSNFLPRTE